MGRTKVDEENNRYVPSPTFMKIHDLLKKEVGKNTLEVVKELLKRTKTNGKGIKRNP